MERVREPLSLNRTRLSNSLEARTLAGFGPNAPQASGVTEGQPSERDRAATHGSADRAALRSNPRRAILALLIVFAATHPPFAAAAMSDAIPTNISQNQVQVHVNSDQGFTEDRSKYNKTIPRATFMQGFEEY